MVIDTITAVLLIPLAIVVYGIYRQVKKFKELRSAPVEDNYADTLNLKDVISHQDKGYDRIVKKLDKVITILSIPKAVVKPKPKPIATDLKARAVIKQATPKIVEQVREETEQMILEELERIGGQGQMKDLKIDIARATKYRKMDKLIQMGKVKKTGIIYHIVKPLDMPSTQGKKENTDDVVGIPW
jgi:hypothetical protein